MILVKITTASTIALVYMPYEIQFRVCLDVVQPKCYVFIVELLGHLFFT